MTLFSFDIKSKGPTFLVIANYIHFDYMMSSPHHYPVIMSTLSLNNTYIQNIRVFILEISV